MTHFIPQPGTAPVPCSIIRSYGKHTYIEVLDERHPITGKRISWSNTDTYGSTQLILSSQIINP
jgi:hypothetical protein